MYQTLQMWQCFGICDQVSEDMFSIAFLLYFVMCPMGQKVKDAFINKISENQICDVSHYSPEFESRQKNCSFCFSVLDSIFFFSKGNLFTLMQAILWLSQSFPCLLAQRGKSLPCPAGPDRPISQEPVQNWPACCQREPLLNVRGFASNPKKRL